MSKSGGGIELGNTPFADTPIRNSPLSRVKRGPHSLPSLKFFYHFLAEGSPANAISSKQQQVLQALCARVELPQVVVISKNGKIEG